MVNLFSSFDPSTQSLSFNWMSTVLVFIFVPVSFWLVPSRVNMLMIKVLGGLYGEFKMLIGLNFNGGILMFVSLFVFVLLNNFLGLFPYVFTSSSHLVFTLSLALPLWLSFMFYGWINHTVEMFVHLVPQGTPGVLMPFMVCIETISNIIRPGTLAVRLVANMIAGHLLIILLGNTGSFLSIWLVSLLIMVQILLLILELSVSIIQSYVFSVLSVLYCSEVN